MNKLLAVLVAIWRLGVVFAPMMLAYVLFIACVVLMFGFPTADRVSEAVRNAIRE